MEADEKEDYYLQLTLITFLVNEVVQLKLPKQSDSLNGEVSLDDQAGNQRHTADNSPLIPSAGRDSSIISLVHSPWSDYGAITSLNRSFRLIIRSGEVYRL
ncbi:hypothetical protein KY290_000535 [Solanum tuberosum]|uniref:Uncharacterized protein n=1 Tax=Solanum tuberosum TaxID=4113 RepID=A0ABQ7WJM4_SOLTU|nr:hypothetical protein KY289_000591 [Solanum tuberosum]KAH0780937.1 hypothetical protein KY290_000535 [Solanum tuberosum]